MPGRVVMPVLPLLSRGPMASSRQTLLAWRSCPHRIPSLVARRSIAAVAGKFHHIPLFQALHNHKKSNFAVHDSGGLSFTYGNLVGDMLRMRERLTASNPPHQPGQRVAFMAENGYDYVVMLLGIFASNCIAVPLSPAFPISELKYIMDNSQATVLLVTEEYAGKAEALLKEDLDTKPVFHVTKKIQVGSKEKAMNFKDIKGPETHAGMMLYTSGTTDRPKGVLIPMSALMAQAESLIEAWKYTPKDRLLHLLPLHHIHGTMNAIITPIMAGSSIEFMFPFNTAAVWKRLATPFLPYTRSKTEKITFLTAVPTIYNRLLASFPSLRPDIQDAAKESISPENLRLNISGSAALPTPTKQAWKDLSNGNTLLERYGMTEVGMAISCGLDFADRVDGSVGWPLPSVEVRLVDTETNKVIQPGEELDAYGREREGEIQLRGPTIFQQYWENPKATDETFVADKGFKRAFRWFKTGDIAIRRDVPGAGNGASGEWAKGPMYFIQGRASVDIIKTGGEKVSALEVERELLSLPQIAEAAVVGLPSEQWGQIVAALVVLKPDMINTGRDGKVWGVMDMRRALRGRLATHKIPMEMKVLPQAIPRNAMGKVNKKMLVQKVFGS
ncbi:acetyl-CoA synthetase-like protein [Aspergillus ellipticus CBS 707.79]|uniref:Acetyl-CoA synthetase-like protein n=1 Tax=Aspergillus ellipticus CBS 707.79 TaxID=1448320 RepID=A0A319DAE8_9EURO|nr:acetyl-CoA synthetase-like protein [Aspergillus ellipticus CBS 707.79]